MNILNYDEYYNYKLDFIKKHHYQYEISTSPMNSDGTYYKDYYFTDGSALYEIMRPVYKTVEIEVNKVKVKVSVKLLETEAYNTDNSESVYYYEKFNHTEKSEI